MYSKYLRKFLERYPAAQMQDIFKFFYQSVLGPGHLISSFDDAFTRLMEEQKEINFANINEPLIEELGNDTIRINLTPYIFKKYDLKDLAKIFYDSQTMYKETPSKLVEVLEANRKLISIIYSGYSEEEFNALIITLKNSAYRPFSHSLIYRNNYDPHYRIVNKTIYMENINKSKT